MNRSTIMRRFTVTTCALALAASFATGGTYDAITDSVSEALAPVLQEASIMPQLTRIENSNGSNNGNNNDGDTPTLTVAPQQAADQQPATTQQTPYAPDVALVSVREGATAAEVSAALQGVEGVATQVVSDEEIASGFVRVELTPGTNVDDAVTHLTDASDVLGVAQPDFAYHVLDANATAADLANVVAPTLTATSNVADLARTLAVSVNDPRADSQWALDSVHAQEAWGIARAVASQDTSAVTVAVLDAGFDITHEDLASNLVAPYNAHTLTTSSTALAGLSHGSHVTGIVSAVADNATGVAGVSHNARVMPIKVTDNLGNAYTSDLVRAYSYLIKRAGTYNVRVVNISMGTAGVGISADDALLRKVDEARAAGIVTVAAAGNAEVGAVVPYDCYPADYDSVVSVMNLQRSGDGVALAASSNRNAAGEADKNIAAPGTAILSTLPGNAYGTMSGTSMASPCVAGVLALEFAANPALTADEATSILYDTACDLGAEGFDETYGHGEVDAAAAVAAAGGFDAGANDDAARRAAEEAAAKAAEVNALIVALPDAGDITLADGERVVTARVAYDALDDAARALVDDARLTAAEGALSELEAAADAARRAAEEEARRKVGVVSALIDALPDAGSLTLGDKGQVATARAAYEALAAELRQQVATGRLVAAESRLAELERAPQVPEVSYTTRVQTTSAISTARDGATAGTLNDVTAGLNALRVMVGDRGAGAQYRTYVQGVGWQRWASCGTFSGITSLSRGISSMQVRLTGEFAQQFDVCYRTFSAATGWTPWVRNGASGGKAVASAAYKLLAIQVKLVPAGAAIS